MFYLHKHFMRKLRHISRTDANCLFDAIHHQVSNYNVVKDNYIGVDLRKQMIKYNYSKYEKVEPHISTLHFSPSLLFRK